MSFYENIVARTKEATAPTEYEIRLLSDNIRRKISTAAIRGQSAVVINTGTDYFRSPNQGGKMVRNSAFKYALRIALSELTEEGFTITTPLKSGQIKIGWT
jgi:hypothetical protein